MKFLVVGLGSMGKRRVRNLKYLEAGAIAGFDFREDRRIEASEKYGISVYDDFQDALDLFKPDALVISTPPKFHFQYANASVEAGLPCFVEASVIDQDKYAALEDKAKEKGIFVAPSCTMRFFPGPKLVKTIVDEKLIGNILSINYQTGQYLEDWHPWENIKDFYVSDPETGACREIVPFEFTWLNDIFGHPTPISCLKRKVSKIDADIDDIYVMTLTYPGKIVASVTVEVLSRPFASRELRLLGDMGQLVFSSDSNEVRWAAVSDGLSWNSHTLAPGHIENGYINPEEPYINEMEAFVSAVSKSDSSIFPNTLKEDARILDLLVELEELSR